MVPRDVRALQAQDGYDPYGQMTAISETVLSDLQYAHYYYHSRSGLNLTPNRAYNASLGRWINRDPIGEAGGINLYAYVGNNPVGFVDPTGNQYAQAAQAGATFGAGLGAPLGPVGSVVLGTLGAAAALGTVYAAGQIIGGYINKAESDKPKLEVPDASTLEGKTPEEIQQIMEDLGFAGESSASGGGIRYPNPDRPGDQVRVMPGEPGSNIPMKQGPYGIVSKGGCKTRFPVAGNPTLK